MPVAKIHSLQDLSLSGKRVFMRVDLNVPLDGAGKITDDNRIQQALPSIQWALENQARLILASHLGRPDGRRNSKYSLEPVALHLAELLGKDVTLLDDCVGEAVELMAKRLGNGEVILLENLRFHPEEEKNDPKFCLQLAQMTDIYVSDAFGTAHRKHASTYGLPQLIEKKAAGFLMEKELKYLDLLIHQPPKPFYLVLGGSKVSDKIKIIEKILHTVSGICVGGAMAYAFLAARGEKVPAKAKQPSTEDISAAQSILRQAQKKEIPVLLPVDDKDCFDIGPKTLENFAEFLSQAKTIFWNGPVGMFEKQPYHEGTFGLAQRLASVDAVKVVGGGDTVAAIKQSGCEEGFTHLSTGGGAVLEYLENGGLPGTDILAQTPQRGIGLDPSTITDEDEETYA